MSLQVLVVHVGERLSADPAAFSSYDAFKSWLANASGVPTNVQILLTVSGKQVKFQALHLESEVFLYNRSLLFASPDDSPEDLPAHSATHIDALPVTPDSLEDQDDIDSWRQLFRARRTWALDVAEKTTSLYDLLEQHADASGIMKRGVGVAIGNLDSHISNLEHRYSGAREWSEGLIQEQQESLGALAETLRRMKSLPGDPRFLALIPMLSTGPSIVSQKSKISLDSFFDQNELQQASKAVKADLAAFADHSASLSDQVQKVIRDAAALFEGVEKGTSSVSSTVKRNASQLLEEVQVLANKVASDCEHVSALPVSQRSVSQASKMALLHTKDYLPALRDYHKEMGEYLNKSVQDRNAAIAQTTRNMRKVAGLEAAFSDADGQVKQLDFQTDDERSLSLISLATQFPFIYGALLLESVRRREWSEKIRSESATLAEDIAGYREEEERRRKKWAKNIGAVVAEETAVGRVLDFELNLQADGSSWPETSREDVRDFIENLRGIGDSQAEAVEELEAGFQDLDRPTKRQLKMAKNFKAGSVHEAFSGKGSFLFRENDEVKALRESNAKLEDEIKGQKSRVRKLEDLLYKQTQGGRMTTGNNLFQGPELSPQHQPSTPEGNSPSLKDGLSRQTSHTSRRPSANKSSEEKALARRIVSLDAELQAEKQKRQDLEAAANGRQEKSAHLRSELEDTRSTKQDLMANLEAQQREFSAERRLLEDNIEKLRLRVEELEDELEKILGSRDNSRMLVEEKTRAMENDLEQANKGLETLRGDLKKGEEAREENMRSLRAIHSNLSPDIEIPTNAAELINGLEELAERTARQARDSSQTVTAVKTEKDELQMILDRREKHAIEAKDNIQSLEQEVVALRNDLANEKARSSTLNEELDDGRQQLKNLRAKFADGETGSEALRLRVEEQASRASALATDLAQAKSHVNSLDVELSSLQRRHNILQKNSNQTTTSLERRTVRARELTNRLVAYHQELIRLLEALNLAVMRRDGVLFIQRSSKLASQSVATLPTDAIGSVTTLPSYQAFDTSINSALLGWAHVEDDNEESDKFTKLLARIDDFNLATFSEAVIKLRRDVEWTGKKWKMEARNYRDKYHRAQSEGHDKIAYRAFKEGDLALFLPTRNQATRPWAAFNVGAPHYFLRERDTHHLKNREWLVARIQKVEERVVDLSRNMSDSLKVGDRRSVGDFSEAGSMMDDDNPFELSDGLRWYLLDAAEDKPGAPSTPGLGKSTVASANVDAKGSIRKTKPSAGHDASTKLNKSLESRRSSSNSKRGSISGGVAPSRESTDANPPASPTVVEPVEAPTARQVNLRPGSRSSVNGPGPSGLGHEVNLEDGHAKSGEETSASKAAKPLTATATSSPPAAGLLGLFGSPPRNWLRRGTSHASTDERDRSQLQPPGNQDSLQQQQSSHSHSKSHSPSPSKLRPSPIRVRSDEAAASPSGTPTRGKSGGWESLWTLDLNSDDKSRDRGSGS